MAEEKIKCPAHSICERLGTSRVSCQTMDNFMNWVDKNEPVEIQVAKTSSILLSRAQGCLSSIVLLLDKNQHTP